MGRNKITVEVVQSDPVDFAQVMVELYNAGCAPTKVAKHLKVAACTAVNWSKGGVPGYNKGLALLKLRDMYCKESS